LIQNYGPLTGHADAILQLVSIGLYLVLTTSSTTYQRILTGYHWIWTGFVRNATSYQLSENRGGKNGCEERKSKVKMLKSNTRAHQTWTWNLEQETL